MGRIRYVGTGLDGYVAGPNGEAPQRSLTGHPGATFFRVEISPHQFFNFFTSS
jgi:hypothetical protein